MYNFSSFISTLYALTATRSISREAFVNQLISPLVLRYRIPGRNNEDYYLDKSMVSKLLTCKADVPSKLRAVLGSVDILDVLTDGFNDIITDTLGPNSISRAVIELDRIITESSTVSEDEKSSLFIMKDEPIKYLANAFLIALRKDNTSGDSHNTVSKGGEDYEGKVDKNSIVKNAVDCKSVILRKKNNNSVEMVIGDLFSYEAIASNGYKNFVVIPVNSAFDTRIDFDAEKDAFPVVSETTVHGQWVKRVLQSKMTLRELDNRIERAIRVQKLVPSGTSITGIGKLNRYPIGSIVPFETSTCIYLLLAISDFRERNVAHTTPADLRNAFLKLLEYYNSNGQGYKLYMPLIGTGRSRSGLSPQESLDLFLSVIDNNSEYFWGNICVVARESDANRITQMGGQK